MGNLFAELKRRHIYRVAAAYTVVAWIVLQIVNNVAPAFNLPGSAVMLVIVLLAAGFPIALIFAWVLELKSPNAPTKTGAMDWVLVAVAIAFAGMFTYQQLAPSRATVTAQSGIEVARDAAAKPAGISLAVLPFANLSSDAEQEFFSDGMTEEITSALTRISDLRVVARTSAFQFKGQNKDMRAIGQTLGATHLIDGSVRKVGNRVRISVQLIKADDGVNVWGDTYDRELTDVFAIQEEIGRAIAGALRMPLGLKPGQNLVSSRDIGPEIYQEFLRIRAKQRTAVGNASRLQMIEGLENLLTRAPNFAKGWAFLSSTYFGFKFVELYNATVEPAKETRQQLPPIYDKAEKAAREAIRLDETEAVAYETLASIEVLRGNWLAAEDLLRQGLNFDPYDPDLLAGHWGFLVRTGHMKQALQVAQEVHALEPLPPVINFGLAWSHVANNQPDAAIALLEGRQGIGAGGQSMLATAYAMTGQFDKAADVILQIGNGPLGARWGAVIFEDTARLLRTAPQKVTNPKALRPLHEFLNFVYAFVGAEDRLLDFAERSSEAGLFGGLRHLFDPVYSAARKTERFKKLVRDGGLVEYWKSRGWPDMCHPTTGDDFECN